MGRLDARAGGGGAGNAGVAGAGAAAATGRIVATAGAVVPVVATLTVGWGVTIGSATRVLAGTGGGVDAARVRSRSPTRISNAAASVANTMFEVFQLASRTGVAVTGGPE